LDKKIKIFSLFSIFMLVFIVSASTQAETPNVPEGMEDVKIGTVDTIVPKGSKMRREGNVTFLESTDAYAARRISDMESRLSKIESNEQQIKREIETIKASLEDIKNRLTSRVPVSPGTKTVY
jgi:peptidoglycan hydrolase CwlO-like protein